MTFASAERARLSDLLLENGPDAPTLCEGWTTRDMATHLWVRENRPDAAAGMMVGPLKAHLGKVSDQAKSRDYRELVQSWAKGPGTLNPMRLADKHVNAAEHFIHLEDVRRGEVARGGELPAPRAFSERDTDALYRSLRRMAPMLLRSSTVPVVLQTPGRAPVTVAREAVAVHTPVTVSGEVGELLLWAHGRDAVHVTVAGDLAAVKRARL